MPPKGQQNSAEMNIGNPEKESHDVGENCIRSSFMIFILHNLPSSLSNQEGWNGTDS
jgi:hypothetical protein